VIGVVGSRLLGQSPGQTVHGVDEEDIALNIKSGSTSVILPIDLRTSSGQPKTGVTYEGVVVTYVRQGASGAQVVVLSAGAPGVWSDGGWCEVDAANAPGAYQLGLPNAALAAGAREVRVYADGATFQTARERVLLVGYDPLDAVRMGLTALPHAEASATGGLPTLDSDGDVSAKVVDPVVLDSAYDAAKTAASASAVASLASAVSTLDAILDDVHDTDLPAVLAQATGANAQASAAVSAIAALNDIDAAGVVTALMAEVLDGTMTFREALIRVIAFVSGHMTRTGTDPKVYTFFKQDGATPAMVHSIPAAASGRTVL